MTGRALGVLVEIEYTPQTASCLNKHCMTGRALGVLVEMEYTPQTASCPNKYCMTGRALGVLVEIDTLHRLPQQALYDW